MHAFLMFELPYALYFINKAMLKCLARSALHYFLSGAAL